VLSLADIFPGGGDLPADLFALAIAAALFALLYWAIYAPAARGEPLAAQGWLQTTSTGAAGFSGDDLVWLLDKAPAEVLILRPSPEDHRVLTT
jgi:hypothetical protein